MKKKINILCGIIICVIILCVVYPTYNLGYTFGVGFSAGYDSIKNGSENEFILTHNTTINTYFEPHMDKLLSNPDSIIDASTNKVVPIVWEKGAIIVHDSLIPNWYFIICVCCEIVIYILFLILIIKFAKLIININKDLIFERINVKLLRQLGILLLCIALSQITLGISTEILIFALPYKFDGYDISAYWNIPWTNVIIGLVGLLMAQIWARGIQMREEQELTI